MLLRGNAAGSALRHKALKHAWVELEILAGNAWQITPRPSQVQMILPASHFPRHANVQLRILGYLARTTKEGGSIMSTPDDQNKYPVAHKTVIIKVPDENVTALIIDKWLDRIRHGSYCDFVLANEKWLVRAGMYGLYLTAVLGLLTAVVLPFRYDYLPFADAMLVGIAWFFGFIAMHYIAWKFLPKVQFIIESTPSKLSGAFLEVYAFIVGVSGIAALFAGIYLWNITSAFETFLSAIFIFIFLEFTVALCLRPALLNIRTDGNISAGEEFIGWLSFLFKSNLRLVPILFGSGVIFGIVSLLELLFTQYGYMNALAVDVVSTVSVAVSAASLPFTGYLLFLFSYFMLDLARSILSLPKKEQG